MYTSFISTINQAVSGRWTRWAFGTGSLAAGIAYIYNQRRFEQRVLADAARFAMIKARPKKPVRVKGEAQLPVVQSERNFGRLLRDQILSLKPLIGLTQIKPPKSLEELMAEIGQEEAYLHAPPSFKKAAGKKALEWGVKAGTKIVGSKYTRFGLLKVVKGLVKTAEGAVFIGDLFTGNRLSAHLAPLDSDCKEGVLNLVKEQFAAPKTRFVMQQLEILPPEVKGRIANRAFALISAGDASKCPLAEAMLDLFSSRCGSGEAKGRIRAELKLIADHQSEFEKRLVEALGPADRKRIASLLKKCARLGLLTPDNVAFRHELTYSHIDQLVRALLVEPSKEKAEELCNAVEKAYEIGQRLLAELGKARGGNSSSSGKTNEARDPREKTLCRVLNTTGLLHQMAAGESPKSPFGQAVCRVLEGGGKEAVEKLYRLSQQLYEKCKEQIVEVDVPSEISDRIPIEKWKTLLDAPLFSPVADKRGYFGGRPPDREQIHSLEALDLDELKVEDLIQGDLVGEALTREVEYWLKSAEIEAPESLRRVLNEKRLLDAGVILIRDNFGMVIDLLADGVANPVLDDLLRTVLSFIPKAVGRVQLDALKNGGEGPSTDDLEKIVPIEEILSAVIGFVERIDVDAWDNLKLNQMEHNWVGLLAGIGLLGLGIGLVARPDEVGKALAPLIHDKPVETVEDRRLAKLHHPKFNARVWSSLTADETQVIKMELSTAAAKYATQVPTKLPFLTGDRSESALREAHRFLLETMSHEEDRPKHLGEKPSRERLALANLMREHFKPEHYFDLDSSQQNVIREFLALLDGKLAFWEQRGDTFSIAEAHRHLIYVVSDLCEKCGALEPPAEKKAHDPMDEKVHRMMLANGRLNHSRLGDIEKEEQARLERQLASRFPNETRTNAMKLIRATGVLPLVLREEATECELVLAIRSLLSAPLEEGGEPLKRVLSELNYIAGAEEKFKGGLASAFEVTKVKPWIKVMAAKCNRIGLFAPRQVAFRHILQRSSPIHAAFYSLLDEPNKAAAELLCAGVERALDLQTMGNLLTDLVHQLMHTNWQLSESGLRNLAGHTVPLMQLEHELSLHFPIEIRKQAIDLIRETRVLTVVVNDKPTDCELALAIRGLLSAKPLEKAEALRRVQSELANIDPGHARENFKRCLFVAFEGKVREAELENIVARCEEIGLLHPHQIAFRHVIEGGSPIHEAFRSLLRRPTRPMAEKLCADVTTVLEVRQHLYQRMGILPTALADSFDEGEKGGPAEIGEDKAGPSVPVNGRGKRELDEILVASGALFSVAAGWEPEDPVGIAVVNVLRTDSYASVEELRSLIHRLHDRRQETIAGIDTAFDAAQDLRLRASLDLLSPDKKYPVPEDPTQFRDDFCKRMKDEARSILEMPVLDEATIEAHAEIRRERERPVSESELVRDLITTAASIYLERETRRQENKAETQAQFSETAFEVEQVASELIRFLPSPGLVAAGGIFHNRKEDHVYNIGASLTRFLETTREPILAALDRVGCFTPPLPAKPAAPKLPGLGEVATARPSKGHHSREKGKEKDSSSSESSGIGERVGRIFQDPGLLREVITGVLNVPDDAKVQEGLLEVVVLIKHFVRSLSGNALAPLEKHLAQEGARLCALQADLLNNEAILAKHESDLQLAQLALHQGCRAAPELRQQRVPQGELFKPPEQIRKILIDDFYFDPAELEGKDVGPLMQLLNEEFLKLDQRYEADIGVLNAEQADLDKRKANLESLRGALETRKAAFKRDVLAYWPTVGANAGAQIVLFLLDGILDLVRDRELDERVGDLWHVAKPLIRRSLATQQPPSTYEIVGSASQLTARPFPTYV